MIDWPEKLVDAIARRKSVLFLGSGISANSKNENGEHPPTWNSFLRSILDSRKATIGVHRAEIEKLLDKDNYLMACELIVDIIGQNAFGDDAANAFRRPRFSPAEIHKVIYGLDSKIVITPNVDKIYDECALTESHSSAVIESYFDSDLAKYLRTEDYLVIKAHGSVDDTSKMIFTHKDYSFARCKYSAFYRLLDALILTHTFVFLGCGINDPDIALTLENANFLYDECPPHYLVAPNDSLSDSIKKVLLRNRNIEVITYDNADGKHEELLKGLKELSELVDNKRDTISSNCTW